MKYTVVIGPRGTGKSHLFQQISPASHLISGGKATVARMFLNNATGQRGLVAQYDVVCFDEISGVSFDQNDGVNIMKGYMESGEFSRGRESIRANGSLVFVGNFEVDVEHQQRIGHLLEPLPPESPAQRDAVVHPTRCPYGFRQQLRPEDRSNTTNALMRRELLPPGLLPAL